MGATHYYYQTVGEGERIAMLVVDWSFCTLPQRRRNIHNAILNGQYIAPIPTKYEGQHVDCDELTAFLDGQLDFPER